MAKTSERTQEAYDSGLRGEPCNPKWVNDSDMRGAWANGLWQKFANDAGQPERKEHPRVNSKRVKS